MTKTTIILSFAMGLIFVCIGGSTIYAINKYNSMTSESIEVEAQWAMVQNVYQRRSDLIPNIVKSVKGAAKFEKDTFVGIADARASVGRVTINKDKAPESAEELKKFDQAQGNISQALSKLMMITENYPQLKATQQFADLTLTLEGTENRISVERRNFNVAVKKYNEIIKNFPGSLLAGFFGLQKKPFFEGDEQSQKAPTVDFD